MFSTTQKLSTFYSRKKILLGLRPAFNFVYILVTADVKPVIVRIFFFTIKANAFIIYTNDISVTF